MEAEEDEAGRWRRASRARLSPSGRAIQLRAGGVALSEPQLFAHCSAAPPPAPRPRRGRRRRALQFVVPPSDLDLVSGYDKPPPAARPRRGAALADALVAGLRPAAPPGAAPTGDAIAEWMVRVADGLNA